MPHTPGPWEFDPEDASEGAVMIMSAGTNIASVYGGLVRVSEMPRLRTMRLANARLIAAAPELLAACKDVSVLLSCGGVMRQFDGEPWVGRLRDAIAKAEGGQ